MRKKNRLRQIASAAMAFTLLCSSVQADGLQVFAEENEPQAQYNLAEEVTPGDGLLAYLDFDDEENGFSYEGKIMVGNEEKTVKVTAVPKGTNELADSFDAKAGKCLHLDGTGSNYLTLVGKETTNLLQYGNGFTISYWSKVESEIGMANWAFYLNEKGQNVADRDYIGALDVADNIHIERGGSTRASWPYSKSYLHAKDYEWKLITVACSDDKTDLYVNGIHTEKKSVRTLQQLLGSEQDFWLGYAPWGAGEYFNGYIDDFAVYNYAMDEKKAMELYHAYLERSLTMTDEDLQKVADNLLHDTDNVRGNISLPDSLSYGGLDDMIQVTWSSDDADGVVTLTETESAGGKRKMPAGVVTRPENGAGDKTVHLTAELKCERFNKTVKKNFELTIKEKPKKEKYVDYVYTYFLSDLYGQGESQNIHMATSEDSLNWKALNNSEPILKAADLRTLDGEKGTGGVRDSFLLRSAEGDHFYLIGTDLDSDTEYGWGAFGGNGSHYICVWESDDLVNWSDGRLVPLAFETASCMWAPEATYDPVSQQYLVYWSSGIKDGTGKHIYCAWTRDFYTFSDTECYKYIQEKDGGYYQVKRQDGSWGERVYVSDEVTKDSIKDAEGYITDRDGNKGLASDAEQVQWTDEIITYLDTSMLHYKDTYYRFTKRENDVTIMLEKSDDIKGPWTWVTNVIADQYGVEGPAIYKIEDEEDLAIAAEALGLEKTPEVLFCLYMDGYANRHGGYYPLIATSVEDLEKGNFQVMPEDAYELPIGAKHGSFVPITKTEYDALQTRWGSADHKEEVGCIVHYNMEEENGALKDNSGNGNNGTFYVDRNAPEGSGAKVEDNILKLDGQSYIALPTNLLTDEETLTISMWVENTAASNQAVFYFGMKNPYEYCMLETSRDNSYNEGNNLVVSYTGDNRIYFDEDGKEIADPSNYEGKKYAQGYRDGHNNEITITQKETDSDWSLYTITIDGDSQASGNGSILSVYCNGELVGTEKTELKTTDFGNALISYIGRSAYGGLPYFVGNIKEFQIWDTLWDDADIAEEYQKLQAYKADRDSKLTRNKEKEKYSRIASFSFDSEEGGFTDSVTGAKAVAAKTPELSEDGVVGKALHLDKEQKNYLMVTDVDGRSLLADYGEITFSYWSKVAETNASWSFMALKTAQNVGTRKYIGVLDNGLNVTVERSNGEGGSPGFGTGTEQDTWKLVTVVCTEDETRLYINKELAQTQDNTVSLSDIFKGSSVLKIGMADWGGGEYFAGYLDEFQVYNYARSEEEIAKYYDAVKNGENFDDIEAVDAVIRKINAIGDREITLECKEEIEAAREAYDALSEEQKERVSDEILKILEDAEEAYKKLEQERPVGPTEDEKAANAVIDKINAIGKVTLTDESKAKIKEARDAYDALSPDQKKLVSEEVLKILTDAEDRYEELEAGVGLTEDERAAAAVKKLIEEIGTVNLDSKEKIEAARKAYNALTDDQKKLISANVLKILEEAEAEYKKQEEENGKPPVSEKIDISKAAVSIPAQTYTGKALTPAVTVTCNGKKLILNTDYTVNYRNNVNIGTATVSITGTGSYTGTVTSSFAITVKKGKAYTVGNYKYKITNASINGNGTVSLTGVKSSAAKKNLKKITVGAAVKIGGKSFKVTAVGNNAFSGCAKATSATIGTNVTKIGTKAFYNCKKLTKVTIKSTKLKSVGKNAIKGISKKATIKCPKKQLKKYKKLFKASTGYKKTMKIK